MLVTFFSSLAVSLHVCGGGPGYVALYMLDEQGEMEDFGL